MSTVDLVDYWPKPSDGKGAVGVEMSDFTDPIKAKIREHLKKMNAHFKAALDAIRAGDYQKAISELVDAFSEKISAIIAVPPIPTKPGLPCPFSQIYDLFYEMDQLADLAKIRVELDGYLSPATVTIEELIKKIRNLIDEFKKRMLKHYKPNNEDAEDILKGILRKLRKMVRALEDFSDGEDIDLSEFEGLPALKKEFLDAYSHDVSYWVIYDILMHIDRDLEEIVERLKRYQSAGLPPDSRPIRVLIHLIELIEELKRKLEKYLEPPAPQFPPGGEDLPPFPPPDHA